jgi:hypothetical protein
LIRDPQVRPEGAVTAQEYPLADPLDCSCQYAISRYLSSIGSAALFRALQEFLVDVPCAVEYPDDDNLCVRHAIEDPLIAKCNAPHIGAGRWIEGA